MAERDLTKQFGRLLREIRVALGQSQEELAHECDLDRTYISMLERGLKSPTLNTIVSISRALKVSPHVFLNEAFARQIGTTQERMALKLPLLGSSLSCGKSDVLGQEVTRELDIENYITEDPKNCFYAKAQGHSMEPTILDGDLLAIETSRKHKSGDIVLVQINDEYSVKRFTKNGSTMRLTPDNPRFTPIDLYSEQRISICGVVTTVIRSL